MHKTDVPGSGEATIWVPVSTVFCSLLPSEIPFALLATPFAQVPLNAPAPPGPKQTKSELLLDSKKQYPLSLALKLNRMAAEVAD